MVLEVMRSGRLSLGPMLERFERRFAEWLGVDDAVAVSSGTSALHLGVRALGWGPGDEVVTSPFSFAASANCLLYEGATPVFCDIDPVTLDIDPAAAGAATGERTAGLLPVHILGYPAAMPELETIAAARGLGVLEDACEAAGAVDSEGVTSGRAATRRPSPSTPTSSSPPGRGHDRALLARGGGAASQRAQPGPGARTWAGSPTSGWASTTGSPSCRPRSAWCSSSALDEMLAERSRVAALYTERLEAIGASPAGEGDRDGLVLPCRDRGAERRSWFIYALLLPRGTDRDAVVAELGGQGIQAKAYMPCIHLMPYYRERFGFSRGPVPGRRGRLRAPARASVLRREWARRRWTGSARRSRKRSRSRATRAQIRPVCAIHRTVSRTPSSQGLNSTPSSVARLGAVGPRLPEQEVELAGAEQRGAADHARDAPRRSSPAPAPARSGMVGGTHPRPASSTATERSSPHGRVAVGEDVALSGRPPLEGGQVARGDVVDVGERHPAWRNSRAGGGGSRRERPGRSPCPATARVRRPRTG